MLASKSKSGLSDTSSNKTKAANPRVSKAGRAGSSKLESSLPSAMHNRLGSPKSVDSKPTVGHRSPKISTLPDKQSRVSKGLEVQAQLGVVQEDLKKAREQLASVEQEKTQALEELKNAKNLADEANEKLNEALLAQKRAEESSEIEKFRADEVEQAGIEAAQKKKEEWQNELQRVQNQHSRDAEALLSLTQELQKVRHELDVTSEAKNSAVTNAENAMKIAGINAEEAEFLSAEVNRLKSLLDSKLESVNNETGELVKKLNSEVDALKHELERAKLVEAELVKMEALVEGLRTDLANAKKAELESGKLVDEWKKKAEDLEIRAEEATQSEKSSLEYLSLVMKQLEESNDSLQDSESETAVLRGKIESLELEVARHKEELNVQGQEAKEMAKAVEALKFELQTLEEEKMEALNNAKTASSEIESLLEERNKLMNELEMARDEGEKVKKALEGLTSALHEVSSEARETQERLLAKQAESVDAHAQIEQLRSALQNTQENYEVMLDEARYEIVCLKRSFEKFEHEDNDSRAEWDERELNFVSVIERSDEEAKEDGVQMLAKLRESESRVCNANGAVEDTKAENLWSKERLSDEETELESINQENHEPWIREATAVENVNALPALPAEENAKKSDENGQLVEREQEYDPLQNSADIPLEDTDEKGAEKPKLEDPKPKEESGNGNQYQGEEEQVVVEVKIWESFKVGEKKLSLEMEKEGESVDDELDLMVESGRFDQMNGLPLENANGGKHQQKKKKALFKFWSLLKKKSNQK